MNKSNIIKKIETECGFKCINEKGTITYEGGETAQGYAYVDIQAFKNGKGICFICESSLESNEHKRISIKKGIENGDCETRESLLSSIFEIYDLDKRNPIDKALAEDIALDFLEWSACEGWCSANTSFLEWSENYEYDYAVNEKLKEINGFETYYQPYKEENGDTIIPKEIYSFQVFYTKGACEHFLIDNGYILDEWTIGEYHDEDIEEHTYVCA